jgi:hypothetical protein
MKQTISFSVLLRVLLNVKKIFIILVFCATAMAFSSPASAWRSDLLSFFDPYQKVVARYTREALSYSLNQVDTDYRWFATYHSPEFLVAVDKELHKFYPNGLAPYAEQLRANMESPGQTDIFVAVYAKSGQLKKLLGKENLWQVQLVGGGKWLKPVLVEEVELNPMHYKLYPYLTKWYKGFRIVFPFRPTGVSEKFQLQISGPLGSHEVEFVGG